MTDDLARAEADLRKARDAMDASSFGGRNRIAEAERRFHELKNAPPLPAANEPGAYGIGSSHWPGIGKVAEEMNELGVVIGKLFGSGGDRQHWSGDLVHMMRDEIADVRAALDFLVEKNPILQERDDRAQISGKVYMGDRAAWKRNLFRKWHDGAPPEQWPSPEEYGLPPRPAARRAEGEEA